MSGDDEWCMTKNGWTCQRGKGQFNKHTTSQMRRTKEMHCISNNITFPVCSDNNILGISHAKKQQQYIMAWHYIDTAYHITPTNTFPVYCDNILGISHASTTAHIATCSSLSYGSRWMLCLPRPIRGRRTICNASNSSVVG